MRSLMQEAFTREFFEKKVKLLKQNLLEMLIVGLMTKRHPKDELGMTLCVPSL